MADIEKLRALLAAAPVAGWLYSRKRREFDSAQHGADGCIYDGEGIPIGAILDELARLRELAAASFDVCVPNERGTGCGCPPRFYAAREACREFKEAPDANR